VSERERGQSLLKFYGVIKRPLAESQVAKIASVIADALTYLHMMDMAHGSLDLDCIQLQWTDDKKFDVQVIHQERIFTQAI